MTIKRPTINKKKKLGNTEFVHAPEEFIQFLKAEDEDTVAFGRGSLAAAGTDVIDLLIDLLKDEQEDVKFRRRGGEVLTLIGIPAIQPLMEVLEELGLESKSDALTRALVSGALGRIGEPVIEPLILAIGSPLRQVRFGVAIAIVVNRDARAIDALRRAASEGDSRDKNAFNFLLKKLEE